MTTVSYRLGSTWLHEIGPVGDDELTTAADGGCLLAEVTLPGLDPNFAHPSFRRGTLLVAYVGSWPVWRGTFRDFDRTSGKITATGLSSEARRYAAIGTVSSTPNTPISVPDTAITEAVARGLPWTYRNQAPATAITSATATNTPATVYELLDAAGSQAGKRWGVDADGEFYFDADPAATAAPTWALLPGYGLMGTADDKYVTHVYGRRVSAVNAATPPAPTTYATHVASDTEAAAQHGRAEVTLDLTGLGLIDATKADGIVAGVLAKTGPRIGFSTALTVNGLELRNLGGTAAALWQVKPQQVVRCFGVVDSDGRLAFGSTLDFTVGETRWRPLDNTLYVAPVGLAPRSLSDVLQAAAEPPAAIETLA